MPQAGNKRLFVRESIDGPVIAVFDSHPTVITNEQIFMRVRSINSNWRPNGDSKIVIDRLTVQADVETPLIDIAAPWLAGGLVLELYQLTNNIAVRGRRVQGGRLWDFDEDADKKTLDDAATREEITLVATGVPMRIDPEDLSIGNRPEDQ